MRDLLSLLLDGVVCQLFGLGLGVPRHHERQVLCALEFDTVEATTAALGRREVMEGLCACCVGSLTLFVLVKERRDGGEGVCV